MHYHFTPFSRLLALYILCIQCRVYSNTMLDPTTLGCSYSGLLLVSGDTVVVSSGRVSEQGEGAQDIHRICAFSTKDGHPAWDVEVESHAYKGIAGTDGAVILATKQKLHCLRLSDGSSVWRAELAQLTNTKDPDLDPENPIRRAGLSPSPLREWRVHVSRLMLVDRNVVVWLTMMEEMADVSRFVAESWVVLRESDGRELLRGSGQAFSATRKLFHVAEWENGSYRLSTVADIAKPKVHLEFPTTHFDTRILSSGIETVDVVEGAIRWPAVIRTSTQSYLVGSDDERLIEMDSQRMSQIQPGWMKYMAANDGLVVYRYTAGSTESEDGKPLFYVEFVPFDGSEGWKLPNSYAGSHAFTGEYWDVTPVGFGASELAWCLRWNWAMGDITRVDGACLVAVSMTDGSVRRVIPIAGKVHVYGGAMLNPEANSVILVLHESVDEAHALEAPYRIVSIPISERGVSWVRTLTYPKTRGELK